MGWVLKVKGNHCCPTSFTTCKCGQVGCGGWGYGRDGCGDWGYGRDGCGRDGFLHIKFQRANVNNFTNKTIVIITDPHFKSIRGGGWEGHIEPRRRVEGAAGSGAVLSVPKCSIGLAITEIVVTNKCRRQGSNSSIRIVTWAARGVRILWVACSQGPDVLTWRSM